MKISAAVKKETGHIALGVAALTAVMLAIFWIFGAMDASVLWGALLGSGYAVLNFFLLGITVQNGKGGEGQKPDPIFIQPADAGAVRRCGAGFCAFLLSLGGGNHPNDFPTGYHIDDGLSQA